jgi:hypothetical protein
MKTVTSHWTTEEGWELRRIPDVFIIREHLFNAGAREAVHIR